MSHVLSQLALRARAGARALRGFLEGFTGIASAGRERSSAEARRALEERATRRPTCC